MKRLRKLHKIDTVTITIMKQKYFYEFFFLKAGLELNGLFSAVNWMINKQTEEEGQDIRTDVRMSC